MSTRALIFHFRLGPAGARLAHSESEAERVATRELSALRYANVNVGLFCSLKGLFCLYIRPLLTRVRTSAPPPPPPPAQTPASLHGQSPRSVGRGGWGDVEETRRYGGRATSAHTTGIYLKTT